MIQNAYVQYQSEKAAEDMFETMELMTGHIKIGRDVHYIDNETAAANLDFAQRMVALKGEE